MNAETKQYDWTDFIKFYSEQNRGRETRLGVFENETKDIFNDYWLEAGLPLAGIDADTRGDLPAVEIMLGDDFTHVINNAVSVRVSFNFDQNADGLDITDAEGKTTILRFEN